MKFTRIITFSLISVLSIGSLVTVAEVNKTTVNRKFTIEDQKGNREMLANIALENVIKVDTNSFEKVVLTKDQVSFKETKYDLKKGVGEKVLKNKELYRGSYDLAEYENSKYMMTADFNSMFPYTSNEPYVKIAKKDKKTNHVLKEMVTLPDITTNDQVFQESLFEMQGKMYYAIIKNNMNGNAQKNILKVYEINVENLQLEELMSEELSVPGNYTNVSSIVSDGEKLYVVYGNEKEKKLLTVDSTIFNKAVVDFPILDAEKPYIGMFNVDDNNLYIHTNNTVYIMDKRTLKLINNKGMSPSFLSEYEYVYESEQTVVDKQLYVLYEAYKQNGPTEMYIVAYDVTDGNTLYEGKLPSMENRGVGKAYTFSKND